LPRHTDLAGRWIETPLADKLTAPIARAFIKRTNAKAMRRLAEQLATAA
jgi:hypothetical protein